MAIKADPREVRISQLTDFQKARLMLCLDKNTFIGLLTASAIAGGAWGDMTIFEIFKRADQSDERAQKIGQIVVDNPDDIIIRGLELPAESESGANEYDNRE